MDNKFMPILLIGLGLGFLMRNLGIINFSPWELWPALIIGFAANQLYKIFKRDSSSEDSSNIVLWLIILAVGFYLLLPVIGISAPILPRKIFWPVILILIGILQLLPGERKIIKFEPTMTQNGGPVKTSLIGEINRGPNWVLDDISIRHGIGSVNLDLTQAMIPEREVTLDIGGYVGEAIIYLPPELAFKIECSLSIGEVTVLDFNESGTGKHVEMQSPDYDAAVQKVNIKIHWKIGEIKVHQIR